MDNSTLTIPWTAIRLLERKARRARRRWATAKAAQKRVRHTATTRTAGGGA